jgi:phosphohistidine phosphatase SixA
VQALQPFTSSAALALVGHEPSMDELASYLLTADTGHVQLEFRKGGVALLEMNEGLRPGAAHPRWLLQPKPMRAIAK